ncbi:MAG: hypothetical protein D6728_15875 [Cyanobacteria bacterium J055]|nr:MAG: hypothetical protein D6728_15875 [Cyanobacteria bacterium J055]
MRSFGLVPKSRLLRPLAKLTKRKKWESASLLTRSKLLALARDNFSCEDMRTLDRLWVEASQGQFGLSVQLRYKERQGVLGSDNLSIKHQLDLGKIYPSRPSFGTYGATLDNQLKGCGIYSN